MPGNTPSRALMEADHWKSQETGALKAVRRFFATVTCVCKQSSNLLKLMPELLQDFLDAWTI